MTGAGLVVLSVEVLVQLTGRLVGVEDPGRRLLSSLFIALALVLGLVGVGLIGLIVP